VFSVEKEPASNASMRVGEHTQSIRFAAGDVDQETLIRMRSSVAAMHLEHGR
jgi:hypothetical protein